MGELRSLRGFLVAQLAILAHEPAIRRRVFIVMTPEASRYLVGMTALIAVGSPRHFHVLKNVGAVHPLPCADGLRHKDGRRLLLPGVKVRQSRGDAGGSRAVIPISGGWLVS